MRNVRLSCVVKVSCERLADTLLLQRSKVEERLPSNLQNLIMLHQPQNI